MLSPRAVRQRARLLHQADPETILQWTVATFPGKTALTVSFGGGGVVLAHLISRIDRSVPVIFLDTGFHFPETHAFMEQLRHRFDLNVWVYRTLNDPIAYLQSVGETDPTIRTDIDRCCAANKNEPFERAMRRFKKQCERAGILGEIRKREHYEKPSVKKKKKAAAARKRLLKKLRREQ